MENLPAKPANAPILGLPGEVTSGQSSNFDFWGLLTRRKWIVFIGLITGLGLGYLYHTQATPLYESRAIIQIEPKNPISSMLGQNGALILPDFEGDYTTRHDKIIDTAWFADITLKSLDKKKLLEERPSLAELSWINRIEELTDSLEVIQDADEPNIFHLSYTTTDEDDAKLILSHIVDGYAEDLTAKFQDRSSQVLKLFNDVNDKLQKTARDAYTKYDEIYQKKDTISINDRNMTLNQVKVRQLDEELSAKMDELSKLRAEQSWVELAMQGGIQKAEETVWLMEQSGLVKPQNDDWVETKTEERIKQVIMELKIVREERTASGLGENHPDVKSIDGRIAVWEEYLKTGVLDDEAQSQNILTDEEILRRIKTKIDRDVALLDFDIVQLNEEYKFYYQKALEMEKIQHALDLQQEQIDMIKHWLQDAEASRTQVEMTRYDNTQGYNFAKLTEPQLGTQVWPNIFLILGVAGLLGDHGRIWLSLPGRYR